jgi:hypothetical protein
LCYDFLGGGGVVMFKNFSVYFYESDIFDMF